MNWFWKRKKSVDISSYLISAPRCYQLRHGDIFTVSESYLIHVVRQSNQRRLFLPLKRYKMVTWYKPRTWFAYYWQIEYIAYQEEQDAT